MHDRLYSPVTVTSQTKHRTAIKNVVVGESRPIHFIPNAAAICQTKRLTKSDQVEVRDFVAPKLHPKMSIGHRIERVRRLRTVENRRNLRLSPDNGLPEDILNAEPMMVIRHGFQHGNE